LSAPPQFFAPSQFFASRLLASALFRTFPHFSAFFRNFPQFFASRLCLRNLPPFFAILRIWLTALHNCARADCVVRSNGGRAGGRV
jgi:hypothetical protein